MIDSATVSHSQKECHHLRWDGILAGKVRWPVMLRFMSDTRLTINRVCLRGPAREPRSSHSTLRASHIPVPGFCRLIAASIPVKASIHFDPSGLP